MRKKLLIAAIVLLAGCGGGGTHNGGNNPPPVTLLAPTRYFPSPSGAHYTYHASNLVDPLFGFTDPDFAYVVEANPLGSGVYYNTVDQADFFKRGPVFDGLSFSGMEEEDATATTVQKFTTSAAAQADVLPASLSALGDSWNLDFGLGAPADPFVARDTLSGTATAAAVEDKTLGGTVFKNCLRVDATVSYSDNGLALPALSISYWLAPDVGPILAIAKVAGLEVGRVQLVSATIP